jgi:hypothetical protein
MLFSRCHIIGRPCGVLYICVWIATRTATTQVNVWQLLSLSLGRHSGADGVVPGAGYHQDKVAAPRAVTPIARPSSTFLVSSFPGCYLADVILLDLLVETCMFVSMDYRSNRVQSNGYLDHRPIEGDVELMISRSTRTPKETSKLDVGTLGVDFCTLGQHIGDPGVHWDTKGDTLGSRVGFS